MAMEDFSLGDLQQHMAERLPECQVTIIVMQLLKGLRIMQLNNLIHRDLKPQNIFVIQKHPVWWVKIGDFTIANRVVGDKTSLSTDLGTQSYKASEVLR